MPRRLLCLLLVATLSVAPAVAQTAQMRGADGTIWYSLADTGGVARAARAVAEDPRDVERLIALGLAQSAVRQFNEAIASFTRALELEPGNAVLYRWRGHRFLSVRSYDLALADLSHGARLDSTLYGIWYHLGVVRYLRGEFALAATAFARARPLAPNAGELAGSFDWEWMALRRAGRAAEAAALLAAVPDSLIRAANNAYARRLQLYQGRLAPEQLLTPADTADVQAATLGYGLGTWYLVRGDTTRARAAFARALQSGGWPAFGFMAAESDLARLR